MTDRFLRKHNYNNYESSELLNEYYIFIIENDNRVRTYEKLINDGEIFRYMNKTISKTIINHTTFRDNCKKKDDILNLDIPIGEIEDVKIEETFYLMMEEIIKVGEDISKRDNNYWKFEYWKDYYLSGYTYKRLSEKYGLTISPIWGIVHNYNELMKKELKND